MKRIRIKKEIALVWAVTTNGHEESLVGRNLSLFLVDPKYRKTAKTFHIENGNEVHFRVYPSEQPFTGVYTLELWENLGGQDQTVVDKRSAFELVNFTPQECDGSVDDIHAAEVFIGAGNLAVGIHGRGIVSVTKVSEDPNDWDYRILYDDGATEIIQIARGEKGLTDEEHAELIAETLAAKSAAQSANLAATLAASKAAEAAEAAQTATNAAEAANAAKEAADAATEAAQEATAAANAAKTAANNAATLANNAAANANTKAALAQAAADATNAAIAAASTATAAANAATAAANTAAEAANTAASTANSAASNASAKATLANNAATAANAAKDAANSAASAAALAAALANDAAARAEAAILTIENKIERVELVCEDDQHITRKGSSVALTYDEVKALVDEPKNFVTLRYLDMFWMLPSYDDGGAIMFTSSGIEFGHVVVTRVILNTDGQMNNYSIIAEDADHKTDDMSKETAMDGHMTYPTTHAVNLKLDDLQSKITELDGEVFGEDNTEELTISVVAGTAVSTATKYDISLPSGTYHITTNASTFAKSFTILLYGANSNQLFNGTIGLSGRDISVAEPIKKVAFYCSASNVTSTGDIITTIQGIVPIVGLREGIENNNKLIKDVRNIGLGAITDGYINSANGNEDGASSYKKTDYIRINATRVSVVATTSVANVGFAFYDRNKTYISGFDFIDTPVGNAKEVAVPINAVYFRYCAINAQSSNMAVYNVSLADIINKLQPINTNPCEYTNSDTCGAFNKILCIGDSLTQGTFEYDEGGSNTEIILSQYSYPTQLAAISGRETTNKGDAGKTTKTWWQVHQNDDLSGHDACIIALGTNDALGGVGRETTSAERLQYMGNIISKVKTDNPQIKIFVSTMLNYYSNAKVDAVNADMRTIANTTSDCYLVDISAYGNLNSVTDKIAHLNAVGYRRLARYYFNYLSYLIDSNAHDFKFVQFVGTSHTHS